MPIVSLARQSATLVELPLQAMTPNKLRMHTNERNFSICALYCLAALDIVRLSTIPSFTRTVNVRFKPKSPKNHISPILLAMRPSVAIGGPHSATSFSAVSPTSILAKHAEISVRVDGSNGGTTSSRLHPTPVAAATKPKPTARKASPTRLCVIVNEKSTPLTRLSSSSESSPRAGTHATGWCQPAGSFSEMG